MRDLISSSTSTEQSSAEPSEPCTSVQVRCDEPVSAEARAANGPLEQLRNGGTLMRPGRLVIVSSVVFVCFVIGSYKHA